MGQYCKQESFCVRTPSSPYCFSHMLSKYSVHKVQISNHSCYLCTSQSWVAAGLRCMMSIETRENKGNLLVAFDKVWECTACLETAEKLGDIINHRLVIISCVRGGPLVAPLTLLCIVSLFALEFGFVSKKK
jgi:hypothetical protein